jgi:transcriptional regulator with XRE-family HTH domain
MNDRPAGGPGRDRPALRSVPDPGSRPPVHYGDRLREFRVSGGLTQEQAAVYAGLTRKTIARLESARFPNPQLSTLLRLMKTYNVSSLEELFGASPSARLAEAWEEEDWDTSQEASG